ncbi:hypothetical protein LPJ59_004110 [Coemansia sp. RSA 2399]|nr:hypothetical protein LPJ59_004110 [Coemansia sp. RSA 2399]KAJ1901134.1 hypothetical protein LPJ81_003808 [Coemansia sp. IMI 209127]
MTDSPTNPLAIGCPRVGCKCTIIRAGAATLVQRNKAPSTEEEDTQSNDATMPGIGAPNAELNSSSVPDQITALIGTSAAGGWYWMLSDMMDFENVGFSHTVGTVKYLSCADCDLAPLGYHDTALATAGTKEFLIAANRVVYR